MPDFTPLTAEAERHLRGLETWSRQRLRFELREAKSRAVVRLAAAIGAAGTPGAAEDPAELRRIASLLRRQADARDSLAPLAGARRACERSLRALRGLLELRGER
jgi:hypothetical protein